MRRLLVIPVFVLGLAAGNALERDPQPVLAELGDYKVGDKVKIGCANVVLAGIVRTS